MDRAAAYQTALQQAQLGGRACQYLLGRATFDGDGTAQNRRTAAQWFWDAANEGHAEAARRLGEMYRDADGLPHDLFQARHWFETAARLGDPSAGNALAEISGD
ncbi:tetratricopeptide repeat protein [Sulfitobacter porphyrae]|uniref:Tetratricopeptide repeat protein n=1 Tax=Sulfitobacter porphyrae TaxID=1246864 RepID=A0ABW2B5F5_9RHOB